MRRRVRYMLKSEKCDTQYDKVRSSVYMIWMISIILLFSVGCAQKNNSVDLYVDAVMLRELNENEKAIEKLNAAIQLNNRFSLAYSLLGDIYQELRDYEKSATAYEKAAKLNPWSFKDFFNLGRVYQIMRRFERAARAYVRACELKPNHLEAHINTAKCFYEIKDYDRALVYGERARQINPNAIEIQEMLGDIYELRQDYGQAIRLYKRALEINSNNPKIMTSLALAYLKTNCSSLAEELLTSVVRIQPDNGTAYQYLGYCYLQFYDQAVKSYKRLLEIDSSDAADLASLKENANEAVDKAIENYSRAIEINNEDWQAYKGLGVAYMLRALESKDEELKAKALQQWRLSLEHKADQPSLRKLIRHYSR